jgi:hypothetical protein
MTLVIGTGPMRDHTLPSPDDISRQAKLKTLRTNGWQREAPSSGGDAEMYIPVKGKGAHDCLPKAVKAAPTSGGSFLLASRHNFPLAILLMEH